MAILVISLFLVSCSQDKKESAASDTKYTCPMHPQIVQDAPGTCPICNMDLVPMNQGSSEAELMLNESQIQLANVKTMKTGTGNFSSSKILNGRLVSNAEADEVISSKFAGRIEKLFVKETGRPLSAGAAVFTIYSEQLQTLQQDYLLQLTQAAEFPQEKIYQTLQEAARNKLALFGYTNAQIKALAKNNQASPNITVFAKRSGIVKEISVTEGSYVAEGTPVINIENLDRLWVEADVYPSEISLVKKGTAIRVMINGIPDSERSVRIDYVSPQVNPGTQMLTVRGAINNPSGILQPGMQARVLLPTSSVSNAVRLPVEAVIRTEQGAHIWIKNGKETFTPRNVTTGAEDADQIVIISGLKEGEEVVTSGAYLLYSEFILKKGADPLSAHKHR